jgi:hypothetical protein
MIRVLVWGASATAILWFVYSGVAGSTSAVLALGLLHAMGVVATAEAHGARLRGRAHRFTVGAIALASAVIWLVAVLVALWFLPVLLWMLAVAVLSWMPGADARHQTVDGARQRVAAVAPPLGSWQASLAAVPWLIHSVNVTVMGAAVMTVILWNVLWANVQGQSRIGDHLVSTVVPVVEKLGVGCFFTTFTTLFLVGCGLSLVVRRPYHRHLRRLRGLGPYASSGNPLVVLVLEAAVVTSAWLWSGAAALPYRYGFVAWLVVAVLVLLPLAGVLVRVTASDTELLPGARRAAVAVRARVATHADLWALHMGQVLAAAAVMLAVVVGCMLFASHVSVWPVVVVVPPAGLAAVYVASRWWLFAHLHRLALLDATGPTA